MTTHQLKLDLIQAILEIKEPALLKKAAKSLQGILGNSNGHQEGEEFDATKMSFEQWNKQFTDGLPLDEYIPEYGMTLSEFRKKIYEAERSDERPIEEFFEFIDKKINELETKNPV